MLTPLSPSDARSVREFLTAALYSDAEFRKQRAFRELPSRHAGNIPFLLEATREPTLQHVALRLFLFAMPVERRTVAGVFSPAILDILLASGMVSMSDGAIIPEIMLSPLDEFWLAADPFNRLHSEPELVLWPNQTTRALHQASVRRPSQSTLDLGSGCGVLSVMAAQFSSSVVATDLNPRAASFTAFNASLNSVANIEICTGDTFEPVADRKFDLILANPPFFVTPTSSTLYCENQMELDQYCRRVVREGAHYLNEGGYLQMTFEFVQVEGQTWQERLSEWLDGAGCDAWILRRYVRDPEAYAYERTKDGYAESPEKATLKFNEWVAYYRERGVESICGGMLSIRRRSGANWLRIEDLPAEAEGPFGASILQLFDTQTFLHSHPADEELLQRKPLLAPDTTLEQSSVLANGRWTPHSIQLSLHNGLPATLGVELAVAQFIARCDGTRTLADLVLELTQTVKASPEQIRQQCCAVVRKLAERRFVAL